jgi:hypothetical protein
MSTPKRNLGQVVVARILDDRLRDVVAGQDGGDRAQVLRQLKCRQYLFALGRRKTLQGRSFHIDRVPVGAQLACQACGAAHHMLAARPRADADQQRCAGLPDRIDRI